MKTKVIIEKGWVEIASYDFLLSLSSEDIVAMPDGFEYRVTRCLLDLSDNTYNILVK